MAEEQRPPIFSVKTESVVGLEEKVKVSEPQIDSENDSPEKCSNDEQGLDIGLAQETTPIDMIIGDKADIEKFHSAKLFGLEVEINNVIMPEGHNNCLTYSAAENEKYFAKSKIFGENSLFGLERNQFENFDIKRSRLGIKHRWSSLDYGSTIHFCFLKKKRIYFLHHSAIRPMLKNLFSSPFGCGRGVPTQRLSSAEE